MMVMMWISENRFWIMPLLLLGASVTLAWLIETMIRDELIISRRGAEKCQTLNIKMSDL